MIKIAIVEDDDAEATALMKCLERYSAENEEDFSCVRYRDAFTFLEEKQAADIAFMDIMLPNMTGMEAAEEMRKYNREMVLIFVTTMAQFAIKSYEVDALDYILKPISYERVTMKLRKAIEIVGANEAKMLVINTQNGIVNVSADKVQYVEVDGHKLNYHTNNGTYSEYGTMNELEKYLKNQSFMRCNSCYLVNPKYIRQVNNADLSVVLTSGESLKISQPRRKTFIEELTNWMGQGKC